MKKIFSKLLFMGIAALTLVACSDVPEPYDINDPNVKKSALGENVISYSKNLGTFKAIAVTPDQPWLQDANYSQATGYQTWEGASQKSNREVEGWLVSPAVSTLEAEHVKIKFDQTIKYTNNVTDWEGNHKIFVSDNFDGKDVKSANWKEVTFTPVASPYSDWTTYTSGEIQLPDEMANKPAVFVGFWFKAPATASTTWELMNFVMEKGLANDEKEEEGETIGTKDEPITVAKAIELINGYDDGGSSATDAYVKGKIVSIGYLDTNYKSLSYYISDDGTATNQLQVYSGKGLNGADINAKTDLKVGQTVTVKGKLKKYVKSGNVNPEIDQGSQIVAIEGEGEEQEDNGELGTKTNPITVAKALELINGYANAGQSQAEAYVKGKVVSVASFNSNYKSLTYYISDDGTTINQLQVYSGKGLNGADFSSTSDLAVGAEVIVKGYLKKYVKDDNVTPEIYQNNQIVSLDGNTGGGGEQGGGSEGDTDVTGTGTLSGNTLTINYDEFGFQPTSGTNCPATSTTLSDGTKIYFDKNTGSTAPTYYTTANYESIRVYANNTIKIVAVKNITKIDITATAPGTSDKYNGSDNAFAEGGGTANINKVSDTSVSFSGLNASTVTINNSATTNSKNQLRIRQMVITFAN